MIHYNSDFSGDVLIEDTDEKEKVSVPFFLLKELVAEYVRDTRLSRIEDMSADELLGTE